MATVVQKYAGATAVRSTYSSVYNTSAKGTPAPVASGQAVTYNRSQATQTTAYNSRGATVPPVSTASAGSQAGTVVVKVSGTTTSRITTPAVTASSNHVTTTAGKTTTSKQVGTPAVVATNSVKTTNTGTTATRITTPAVVAGNVTTANSSGNTNRVGTPAVTTYTATNGTSRTLSTPAVTHDAASLQAARGAFTKNLTAPNASENSFMDGVHTVLDVAGFIPVVGDLADLANGVIFAAEGDWVNAGISTAAIFFDAATGAKLATKASKEVIGETVETVAEKAVKNSVEELAEDAVEKAGKETAENVAEKTGKDVVEGGAGVGNIAGKLDTNNIPNMTKQDIIDNIPDDWNYTEHNGFVHIRDADGNIRIRIDPPDKITNYPHVHAYDSDGNLLDSAGNIVDRKSSDGHIPYKDK